MSERWTIFLRFINTLVLSIVCLTTPAWADFKAGEKAYQQGDYATALREWQPLAKQGQAAAQYHLGLLYANGQGVPKDDAQARQWYEKAAVQEHAEAQASLGSLYDYARGGPQDFKMAVRWYRRSAEKGNDFAQRRLGLLYEQWGRGAEGLCPGLHVVQVGRSEWRTVWGHHAG